MLNGYLTQTEIAKLNLITGSIDVTSKRLLDLIHQDSISTIKNQMSKGVSYYHAVHDIKLKRRFYWVDKQKIENPTSANNKAPHPFFQIQARQKASYVVGNPIVIGTKTIDLEDPNAPTPAEEAQIKENDNFRQEIVDWLDEQFDDIMNDYVIGASCKGVEWLHPYIGALDPVTNKPTFDYTLIDARECIPIYDSQYKKKLIGMIRYYTYDFIDEKDMSHHERYKLEWWTDTDVTFYIQLKDETKFVKDPNVNPNPAGHFQTYNSLNRTNTLKQANWTRVPFIPLYNNSEESTDLQSIKYLIDIYDKIKNGWADDIEDIQEIILIVKGYSAISDEAQEGLSELAIFLQNLKQHKVIPVETEGAVSSLEQKIPFEAKEKLLTILRREIYYFGEAVDFDTDKFGNSPSGVALKFLYSGLDSKGNRIIRKLQTALKQFMWFLVFFINLTEKKKYDYEKITFTFNKAMIINEKEKVDMLSSSGNLRVSERTLLENHPLVHDVNEEEKRLEAEKKAKTDIVNLDNVPPVPNNGNLTPEQIAQMKQQQQQQ